MSEQANSGMRSPSGWTVTIIHKAASQQPVSRCIQLALAGLPRSMWAAAVPANYDRKLGTLIEDIYGDHQLMVSIFR